MLATLLAYPQEEFSSCAFLSDSLAQFQPPNPGPTSATESTEYAAILRQMAHERC